MFRWTFIKLYFLSQSASNLSGETFKSLNSVKRGRRRGKKPLPVLAARRFERVPQHSGAGGRLVRRLSRQAGTGGGAGGTRGGWWHPGGASPFGSSPGGEPAEGPQLREPPPGALLGLWRSRPRLLSAAPLRTLAAPGCVGSTFSSFFFFFIFPPLPSPSFPSSSSSPSSSGRLPEEAKL